MGNLIVDHLFYVIICDIFHRLDVTLDCYVQEECQVFEASRVNFVRFKALVSNDEAPPVVNEQILVKYLVMVSLCQFFIDLSLVLLFAWVIQLTVVQQALPQELKYHES